MFEQVTSLLGSMRLQTTILRSSGSFFMPVQISTTHVARVRAQHLSSAQPSPHYRNDPRPPRGAGDAIGPRNRRRDDPQNEWSYLRSHAAVRHLEQRGGSGPHATVWQDEGSVQQARAEIHLPPRDRCNRGPRRNCCDAPPRAHRARQVGSPLSDCPAPRDHRRPLRRHTQHGPGRHRRTVAAGRRGRQRPEQLQLMRAARNQHPGALQLLLEAGTDPNHTQSASEGPLASAVDSLGCRFHDPRHPMGYAPFLCTLDHTRVELAAEQILPRIPRTLCLLFRHGADPRRAGGAAVLLRAVTAESWLTARFITAKGARIIIKNDDFEPEAQAALGCAAGDYDFESVVAILEVEGLKI
ncbi:hypothetical protein ASPACDRAFT_57579 [Aspergillus aculeatus ATCC 16872]|uniref:Uncharacterized protein n=1 Tax=Aspergillus aculeatus (strain ATCC 16872 / CBS 172.66 / WB 5094) TaxID=690307 RepID=A0A1L9X734_ASPA1|nr:uncharacterized protein ASPACDRAFT_57579 [Aspergillus aculeatus ATCC 16872]OJK04260.1 hypothetical protein ASPACDRAFT_57579 [Aspergillus aculeatus ATCC 16872]